MGKKTTGRAKSMPAGLATGATVGMGITIALCAIGAWMIDREILKENTVGYIAIVILLGASYMGCLTAATAIKHRYVLVCSISAMIYYAILLSINAVCFDGIYQGMGVTALLVLCGGTLAWMTTQRQVRGVKKKRVYKTANC